MTDQQSTPLSAEDRLLELIHDQSPTHEWCKADGGRGIGDAHYHELVEAVTAFLAAHERPSALDVEALAEAMHAEHPSTFPAMGCCGDMARRILARLTEPDAAWRPVDPAEQYGMLDDARTPDTTEATIRVMASMLVDLEYAPGEFVRPEESLADFAKRLYDAGFRAALQQPAAQPEGGPE